LAVIATTIALCYVGFVASERLARLLGATGNIVLTRLLGVILAALAAQFVIDGIGGVGR
jgi:multiple antibiotic resistance protein